MSSILEFELLFPQEQTVTSHQISEEESIMLRAKQAYQFIYRKTPPEVKKIEDISVQNKKSREEQQEFLESEYSMNKKIFEKCKEIFGATDGQAQQLTEHTISKQERPSV